jgi:RHS repeat-associated protein
MGYDANGNVTSKSDVGSYAYGISGKPNRLTAVAGASVSHDANGNVTSRGPGKTVAYTSFNLPSDMVDGALRSQFAYGPDRQRVWQHAVGSDGTATTRYVGGLLEKFTPTGGTEEWRHYVPTPSGTIVVRRWAGGSATRYLLTDHLGSTDAVLDEQGDPVVAESFDAWGKRRSGATWLGAPSLADKQAIANTSRDGYTGHEMLDTVGLVHMRGRVYDPTLERFLSVDPLIGDLADSQQVNPYVFAPSPMCGRRRETATSRASSSSRSSEDRRDRRPLHQSCGTWRRRPRMPPQELQERSSVRIR